MASHYLGTGSDISWLFDEFLSSSPPARSGVVSVDDSDLLVIGNDIQMDTIAERKVDTIDSCPSGGKVDTIPVEGSPYSNGGDQHPKNEGMTEMEGATEEEALLGIISLGEGEEDREVTFFPVPRSVPPPPLVQQSAAQPFLQSLLSVEGPPSIPGEKRHLYRRDVPIPKQKRRREALQNMTSKRVRAPKLAPPQRFSSELMNRLYQQHKPRPVGQRPSAQMPLPVRKIGETATITSRDVGDAMKISAKATLLSLFQNPGLTSGDIQSLYAACQTLND